ncbi:hypothetical protein NJG16_05965 [Stenotrophomonas maltophilia]|uniref:hypothetical protein n=1 Tax=Stenotrophomonas lactitubi TaxID=2045214 RepID=UPI002040E07C|nr:hypothetical protein [Stenotrophomonas lactitubi]MCO7469601.1 hypothetical protein [Stenotrophomonas maltophilia]
MSLLELNAQLDAFEKALDEEAFEQADSLLDGHDSTLHALLSQPLGSDDRAPLSALLERQQSLLGLLRQRRDAVSVQMQDGRRSLRAAHAYLQAESLA